ncbi:MAG: type secretion system protein GspD [Verrucomicrobiota bacterium]
MKKILTLLLAVLAVGVNAEPKFQPLPDDLEAAAIKASAIVITNTVVSVSNHVAAEAAPALQPANAANENFREVTAAPAAVTVPAPVVAPKKEKISAPAAVPAPAAASSTGETSTGSGFVVPPAAPTTPAAVAPAPVRTTPVPSRRAASTSAIPSAPAAPASAAAAASTSTGDVSAKAINGAGDTIPAGMIRFQAMPLEQVLDIYAELVGRTLLRPSSLPAASITIRAQTDLTRAEALAALDSVLGMNGIATIPYGEKFMKVVPTTSVNTEGAPVNELDPTKLGDVGGYITHVVQLKNSKPSEVAQALGTFSKIQGSVLPLDSNGILIIRDFTENVKRMLELIDRIDVSVPSEFVSEVIPIRYATATEIASALNGVGGTTSGSIGNAAGGATGGTTTGYTGRAGGTAGGLAGQNNRGANPTVGAGNNNNRFGTQSGTANANGGGTGGAGGAPQTFQQRLQNILRSGGGAGAAGDVQLIGPNKIIADERTNSLLVFATRADMDMIKDIISKLDVVLAQVLIEAVILDVTLGDSFDFGVSAGQRPMRTPSAVGGGNFGTAASTTSGASFLNNLIANTVSSVSSNNPLGQLVTNSTTTFSAATNINYLNSGGGLNYFGQISGSWDVAINAVAGNNKGKVIARPRIQTSHNAPANFFVGETRPYVTGTYGNINGTQSSQYQQTQIGTTLTVTPLINSEGLVVMDIQQQVQQVGGNVSIDGNQVPITQDQSSSAKVSVRTGDTIVMGGFIQNNKTSTKSGIPLLQDIPLLGALFRSTSTTSGRRELLVMIKPTVLPTPEAAAMQPNIERNRLPTVKEAEIDFNREDESLLKAADKKKKDDDKRIEAAEKKAALKSARQNK